MDNKSKDKVNEVNEKPNSTAHLKSTEDKEQQISDDMSFINDKVKGIKQNKKKLLILVFIVSVLIVIIKTVSSYQSENIDNDVAEALENYISDNYDCNGTDLEQIVHKSVSDEMLSEYKDFRIRNYSIYIISGKYSGNGNYSNEYFIYTVYVADYSKNDIDYICTELSNYENLSEMKSSIKKLKKLDKTDELQSLIDEEFIECLQNDYGY